VYFVQILGVYGFCVPTVTKESCTNVRFSCAASNNINIADVTTVDLAKCKSVGMNDYIQNLLIVTYSSLVRGLPNL
jgi:hypothetical protein